MTGWLVLPFSLGKNYSVKMNTTIYHRANHDMKDPYLKVSSKLISDKRLSTISVGLICQILNNSDSYIINVSVLKKRSGLTRNQFYNAWNSLQEHQYVIQQRKGKNSYEYIINETGDCLSDALGDIPSGVH